MKKLKIAFLALVMLQLFSSCTQQSKFEKMTYSPEPSMDLEVHEEDELLEPPRTSQAPSPEISRKMITQGNLRFESSNMDSTRAILKKAIARYDAYIASDHEYKSDNTLGQSISVRVPSENLEEFIAASTIGVKKFDNKNISSKDVTEEYMDLEARIKTKKELELRYIQILKKANKVKDMLDIEQQIGRLRTEIESTEGRLRYLSNKVAYSTITFDFYENVETLHAFNPEFKKGFRNGWENFVLFFVGLVNIWPFIILMTLAGFGLFTWRRLRKQSKK